MYWFQPCPFSFLARCPYLVYSFAASRSLHHPFPYYGLRPSVHWHLITSPDTYTTEKEQHEKHTFASRDLMELTTVLMNSAVCLSVTSGLYGVYEQRSCLRHTEFKFSSLVKHVL